MEENQIIDKINSEKVMRLPCISVIIPIYNVEDYISLCLKSVVSQTYTGPVECVLVDDCGNDNSMCVVRSFVDEIGCKKTNFSFVFCKHEHNRGLSAARNTGVQNASGEYVFFLDSDDYISTDCLEKLIEPTIDGDFDVVLGDLKMFGKERNIKFLPHSSGAIIGTDNIFKEFYIDRLFYVMAWNKLVKMSLFRNYEISFKEGQLHEDELWTYKLLNVISTLYIVDRVTYFYRIREGSITENYSSNIDKRRLSFYDTLMFVLEHPYAGNSLYYEACVRYYFAFYIHFLLLSDCSCFAEYCTCRKKFKYPFIYNLVHGKVPARRIIPELHFLFPPAIGYCCLLLKRFKHRVCKTK